MLARKAAIMEGSKSPDGLVDSDDNARVNGEIPVVGDTLKVKGIGFPVKVTKITESKNTVDARGGAVFTLYIKGPTTALTSTLRENYINSQTSEYKICATEADAAPGDAVKDEEWKANPDDTHLNAEVYRYFDGNGWSAGRVTAACRSCGFGSGA